MSEILEENIAEDTNEYVIIGEENYKTKSVTTGINSIKFTLADMPIADAVEKFSDVSELKIAGEDLKPYGFYKNLIFTSATVNADSLVTIEFHIASATEIRIANLEATQEMQDGAILELANMIGGEE